MDEEKLGQYAYRAYVLRLWQDGAGMPWRASLEAVKDGTRQNFADVDRLIHFLQTSTLQSDEGEKGDSAVEDKTESS